MLPELPDARMDTRKPIVHPAENHQARRPDLEFKIAGSKPASHIKRIFRMMAERRARVNKDCAIATVIYSRG
jgi:hypothetical protein